MTQLVASALAAASATVAASFFGVAGTVVGAALGSVVSVAGGAVYKHSMDRTRDRLKAVALESAVAQRFGPSHPGASEIGSSGAGGDAATVDERAGRDRPARYNVKRLALGAGALFVLVMGAVTVFEVVSGHPLSAAVTGKQTTGTTLDHRQPSSLTPAGTTAPSSSTSPSAPSSGSTSSDPTATVTVTQSPSGSTSPSTDPSGSSSPSGSTSPSAGPTGSSSPAAPENASSSPSG